MSYIRMGHPLVYVKGNSEDYVFPSAIPNGKGGYKTGYYIEDYGNISDSGFIELLFEYWDTGGKMFKEHLLKRLAKRLNVKLREKPLTDKECIKLEMVNIKKFRKENKELFVKIPKNKRLEVKK